MPWESMLLFGLAATFLTILFSIICKSGTSGTTKLNAVLGGLFTVSQTLFSGSLVASGIAKAVDVMRDVKTVGNAVSFFEPGGAGSLLVGVIMSIFIGCCAFTGISHFCGFIKNARPNWMGASAVAVSLFTILFVILGI